MNDRDSERDVQDSGGVSLFIYTSQVNLKVWLPFGWHAFIGPILIFQSSSGDIILLISVEVSATEQMSIHQTSLNLVTFLLCLI